MLLRGACVRRVVVGLVELGVLPWVIRRVQTVDPSSIIIVHLLLINCHSIPFFCRCHGVQRLAKHVVVPGDGSDRDRGRRTTGG